MGKKYLISEKRLTELKKKILDEGKRMTQDEFIKKIKTIFGEKYGLDKVVYNNTTTPVILNCSVHGDFPQMPLRLLDGRGCQQCAFENRGKVKNERWKDSIIEKFRQIHGDFYDYSNSEITDSKTKIDILCKKHGTFSQTPFNHVQGHGCPDCMREKNAELFKKSTNDFILQAKQIHGDSYNYSLVDYKNQMSKVDIICPLHGKFPQTPKNHLNGAGCPGCWNEKLKLPKSNTIKFIEKSKKIHGDKYDYSNVIYTGVKNPVNIYCKDHGPFFQVPNYHLSGNGCPKCSESKGEKFIADLLTNLGVVFIRQKKFEGCFNVVVKTNNKKICTKLPFDFYLPKINTCIEYDGEQHFNPIEKFGGEENLAKVQLRDKLKTEFCKKNNIKLIRVPYTMNFDNIQKYLESNLGGSL